MIEIIQTNDIIFYTIILCCFVIGTIIALLLSLPKRIQKEIEY